MDYLMKLKESEEKGIELGKEEAQQEMLLLMINYYRKEGMNEKEIKDSLIDLLGDTIAESVIDDAISKSK